MEYFFPSTVDEAHDHYDSQKNLGAVFYLAGGTDLAVGFAESIELPHALVDLTRIAALEGIADQGEKVSIGACTAIRDIAQSGLLPVCLKNGARAIGSPQIRNLGTIGGNVCNASPCGDTLAPLIVLKAEFELSSIKPPANACGKITHSYRRVRKVQAEDFFTGPKETVKKKEEILTSINIDKKYLSGFSSFKMIGKRNGQAISQINGALWLLTAGDKIVDLRIAFGSVAPVPLRLRRVENFLEEIFLGKSLTMETLSQGDIERLEELVKAEISPISDVRSSADYRKRVSHTLLIDLLADVLSQRHKRD